jgi:hypothetical protein
MRESGQRMPERKAPGLEPSPQALGLIPGAPPLPKGAKRAGRALGAAATQLQATQDIFRNIPETADLASRITGQEYARARNESDWLIPLQRFYDKRVKPLSKRSRDALTTEITDYVKARETGAPLPTISTLAQDYLTLTSQITTAVQNMREALDVHVKTSSGNVRRTGRIGPDFWPRMLDQYAQRALAEGAGSPQWKALEQHAIATGAATDPADFAAKFDLHSPQPGSVSDFMGNQDRAREAKFPLDFYDFSPEAMLTYLSGAAKRLSEIEYYGQRIRDEGQDAFTLALERVASSPHLTQDQKNLYSTAIRQTQANVYGRPGTHPIAKAGRYGRMTVAGQVLATPLTAIRDVASSQFQTLAYQGVRPYLAAWKSVLDPRQYEIHLRKHVWPVQLTWKAIRSAEDKAAIRADVAEMRDMIGESQVAQELDTPSKVVNWLMRYSGRNFADRWTRGFSYMADKTYTRQWLKAMRTGGARAELAREFAERRFVDPDELLREGGSGPVTDRFQAQMTKDFMAAYTPSQSPPWMDTEIAKFLTQFQKWGYNASRQWVREIVMPTARAADLVVTKGRPQDWSRLGRMIVKVLIASGAYIGAGELNKFLTTAARGGGTADASLAELGKLFFSGKYPDFIRKLFDRAFDDVLSGGGLGLLGGIVAATKGQFVLPKVGRGRDPRDIPGYTIPVNLFNYAARWVTRVTQGGGGPTWDELNSALQDMSSQYRLGLDVGARMGIPAEPFITERAKQDYQWAKAQVRKFERETPEFAQRAGMRPAFGQPGISTIPEGDFTRQEVYSALIRGNPLAARRIAQRWSRQQKDPVMAMKRLSQSMKAKNPIAPGGSYSKDTQEMLKKWASRTLGTYDARRLNELQEKYQRSLEAAGFGAKER